MAFSTERAKEIFRAVTRIGIHFCNYQDGRKWPKKENWGDREREKEREKEKVQFVQGERTLPMDGKGFPRYEVGRILFCR